jgi:hypothetical protein
LVLAKIKNNHLISALSMMFLRNKFFFGFLLVFFFCPALGWGPEVWAAPEQSLFDFDQTYSILKKREILSPSYTAQLQPLLSEMDAERLSGEQCEKLLVRVNDKIAADEVSLKEMFFNVQKLVDQRYAQRIVGISPRAFDGYRRALEGLGRQIEERAGVRTFYASDKDAAICREQLRSGLDLLVNQVGKNGFPEAWGVLRQTLKKVYPLWNEHYQTLWKARAVQGRSDVDRPRRELNAEEKQFMYFFEKIQTGLRRLADVGQSDGIRF